MPASYLVFKTNPLVSIPFTFLTNLLYTVLLTTPLFTKLINLLKLTGTVFGLSTSVLSTSVFKLARFDFSAKLEVSIHVASFESGFVA